MAKADDESTTPEKLIERIEAILQQLPQDVDELKLRRALSLAAEPASMPAGTHRTELLRDARQLIKQAHG